MAILIQVPALSALGYSCVSHTPASGAVVTVVSSSPTTKVPTQLNSTQRVFRPNGCTEQDPYDNDILKQLLKECFSENEVISIRIVFI